MAAAADRRFDFSHVIAFDPAMQRALLCALLSRWAHPRKQGWTPGTGRSRYPFLPSTLKNTRMGTSLRNCSRSHHVWKSMRYTSYVGMDVLLERY